MMLVEEALFLLLLPAILGKGMTEEGTNFRFPLSMIIFPATCRLRAKK